MIMAVSAIFTLYSCQEKTPAEELDGPTVEWASNPEFKTLDFDGEDDELDINLKISAPAGIKSFVVKIDSKPLNNGEGLLDGFKLTELDLVNPAEETAFIVTMILGDGKTVVDATEISLDLSALVPLIAGLTDEDSNHSFTLNIADSNGKSVEKTCTFHRVGVETPEYAAPTMIWEGNEDFAPIELQEEMNVNITVSAPAGIKSFHVDVVSETLSPIIQAINNGSTDMDLIGNADLAAALAGLTGGTLPTGDALLNQTEVNFNLSTLVPLILEFNPASGTDHSFTLTLTDNADQELSKTCTFHYTGVAASLTVDESSVNLWDNTVKLNVTGAVSVAYREKGTENWIEVKAAENGEYIVAPVWNEGKNDAGLTVYTVEEGTGIFAGKTYEFQLDGETVADAELTTATGDVIPNGDMSGWSVKDGSLPYPNAEGESFWDSGNNSMSAMFGANLCQQYPEGVAYLKANMVLESVFAPGNMYTGDFIMNGLTGTASFGKVYDWTARPSALKVSYKANVGTIDQVGDADPEGESYKGKQDITRIYAVVVDWTKQHGVTSGIGTPTGMWDPATAASLDEGAIIGYASLNITESKAEFTDVEIPFVWYDTAAKPAEGNYSIVISCATSNRGDYLTGCSTNELWVDDFEWVY